MVNPDRYDSREDRAKRVALAAIDLACQLARDDTDVAMIDAFRARWVLAGAGWVRLEPWPLNPEDWLPASDIAMLADVTTSAVRKWRARGHITERHDANGRPLYNVGEVLAWLAKQRQRRAGAL